MKIDDRSDINSVAAGSTRAASTEGVNARGSGRGTNAGDGVGDQAELSGLAGKLAEAVNPASPRRAEHLKQLAAQVGAGTYSVSSQELSTSIVDELLSGAGKVE